MKNLCHALTALSINRRVFEGLMVKYFMDAPMVVIADSVLVPVAASRNAEKENALRYVSGYVAYEKIPKGRQIEGNSVC